VISFIMRKKIKKEVIIKKKIVVEFDDGSE
jgi:hypothetical protein